MLKPFEIALLQQDLKAALSVVGKDEIDDAFALLVDHGFSSDEFEFDQVAYLSSQQPGPITGKIVWKRTSNATVKDYAAGHNSRWLMLFEKDLKDGAFGSPATAA